MVYAKLAIIGSRSLNNINIAQYVPIETSEIISGGASGVDTLAEQFADKKRISKHILRPRYDLYRKSAPLIRNEKIIDSCDSVLVFWDGCSKGTAHSIRYAKKIGKPVEVVMLPTIDVD